jgi:O-antigen ligase
VTSPRPFPFALALRSFAGALLAWFTLSALTSFALPLSAKAVTLAVIALTMWNPTAGLVTTIALAPAGLLLAPPPARAAELLVCGFLTAWMLSLWRPIGGQARRSAVIPAALYALWAGASWLSYTIGGAAGTEPTLLPAVVARAVPLDHLVFSSPEPETFTLLPLLAGLALFAAASTITAGEPRTRLGVAAAIAGSAALLSALTIADVVRQWAAQDYGGWFLLRYVRGERFSLHLADLNAAGSHYVLGALIAVGLASGDRGRRALWTMVAVLIAPALWISGSRSAALGGLLVGGSLIPFMRRGAPVRIAPTHVVLLFVALAAVAVGAVAIASGPAQQGTASNALHLRSQFLVTSARMFASAPVFGVGIGHYHERSNEFMPPALRQVYLHENAHNYFAQQFAELGVIGGMLFVWFVVSVLRAGWGAVRSNAATNAATLGLLAGAGGYLLTCVTGHPLLVPEVAIPFWAACGVLAGSASRPPSVPADRSTRARTRWAVVAVIIAASTSLALHVRQYALVATPPGEHGFYGLETADDGRLYVWMTRHGVFYVGPQAGTVTIPLRAPNFLEDAEPFRVAVDIGGRRAGVYEVGPERWATIEIPIRRPASAPFRRIDLRANRSWSPMRDRGERVDDEPRSVMVGETRWTPAGGR